MEIRPFNPAHISEFTEPALAWENGYLALIRYTLMRGSDRVDRTKTGTRSIFGVSQSVDLKYEFPLASTKKMGLKSIFAELKWFIEGSGDERRLAELTHGTRDASKTTIWTANANAPYWIDKAKYVGDLGRVYGVQWRQWTNQFGEVFDQLKNVIDTLKSDPYSRRIIMTAWNPGEFDQMALPPCHMTCQFFVREVGGEKYLSCKMYQR